MFFIYFNGGSRILSQLRIKDRISANSFRGNYSFLKKTLCTVTFGLSTYRCGNYSREETIQGRKLFGEIRYLFLIGPAFFQCLLLFFIYFNRGPAFFFQCLVLFFICGWFKQHRVYQKNRQTLPLLLILTAKFKGVQIWTCKFIYIRHRQPVHFCFVVRFHCCFLYISNRVHNSFTTKNHVFIFYRSSSFS